MPKVKRCLLGFCKNRGDTPGVAFFSLTKDRHDDWMRAIGRDPNVEKLTRFNYICSDHFLDEDKTIVCDKIQLKSRAAVPKLRQCHRLKPPPSSVSAISPLRTYNIELPSTSQPLEAPLIKVEEPDFEMDLFDDKYNIDVEQNVVLDVNLKEVNETVKPQETVKTERSVQVKEAIINQNQSSDYNVEEILLFCFILILIWLIVKSKQYRHITDSASKNSLKIAATKDMACQTDASADVDSEIIPAVNYKLSKLQKQAVRDIKLFHNYNMSRRKVVHKITGRSSVIKQLHKKLMNSRKNVASLAAKVNHLKFALRQRSTCCSCNKCLTDPLALPKF